MLGEALRLIRVFHDMKATELAEQLGISASYLSEIEHERKTPSIALIEKYAEVFRTKPSSILLFHERLDDVTEEESASPLKKVRTRIRSVARSKIIGLLQAIENSSK